MFLPDTEHNIRVPCTWYHINEDGSYTELETSVVNDRFEFTDPSISEVAHMGGDNGRYVSNQNWPYIFIGDCVPLFKVYKSVNDYKNDSIGKAPYLVTDREKFENMGSVSGSYNSSVADSYNNVNSNNAYTYYTNYYNDNGREPSYVKNFMSCHSSALTRCHKLIHLSVIVSGAFTPDLLLNSPDHFMISHKPYHMLVY